MKLINIICFALLVSCNGSDDGGAQPIVDPVNPAEQLTDLGVQNEVEIKQELFENEIMTGYPEFHKSPLKGDRRSLENKVKSNYRFVMKKNGSVIRDDSCVFSIHSQINSVISAKINRLFIEKGSTSITFSESESGDVCGNLIPTEGTVIPFEERFLDFSNGYSHLIYKLFREVLSKTNTPFTKKKDPALAFTKIYKGIYNSESVYRIVYRLTDNIDTETESGHLSYDCQVIINPNKSAHFAIGVGECISHNKLTFIYEDGKTVDFTGKTRSLTKE